jgi:hypothetical protein
MFLCGHTEDTDRLISGSRRPFFPQLPFALDQDKWLSQNQKL